MSPDTKKNDPIGGNWIYDNANGMSSTYRSLHVNTSHDRMAYNESPAPPVAPTFPTTASYFDSYADHFGIRPHIRIRTGVEHATRTTGPRGWPWHRADVPLRRLVVANGLHEQAPARNPRVTPATR